MRTIVWSVHARADQREIVTFLSREAAAYADKVNTRIVAAADQLGRIPTGRPGRVKGSYEKSLPDIHYVMVYGLDDPPGTVSILRIIHTSRNWPAGEWPD